MILTQPRSQGLSSLPPLVVRTETLVAAGHVSIYPSKTAGWVGTQVHLVERKTLLPHSSSRFLYHQDSGWSRDQPQPGSLFQWLREAQKRNPGNKVDPHTCWTFSAIVSYVHLTILQVSSIQQGSNPWPSQYQCSVMKKEVMGSNPIEYTWKFFRCTWDNRSDCRASVRIIFFNSSLNHTSQNISFTIQ